MQIIYGFCFILCKKVINITTIKNKFKLQDPILGKIKKRIKADKDNSP